MLNVSYVIDKLGVKLGTIHTYARKEYFPAPTKLVGEDQYAWMDLKAISAVHDFVEKVQKQNYNKPSSIIKRNIKDILILKEGETDNLDISRIYGITRASVDSYFKEGLHRSDHNTSSSNPHFPTFKHQSILNKAFKPRVGV